MMSSKDQIIRFLKYLPIRFLFRPFYGGQGSILFMHKVVLKASKSPRINLTRANEVELIFLEKMIVYLKKSGYEFISLSEISNRLKNNNLNQKKFIVVTFDDGYKDNYTLAYPLFKKYNIPFTIYITNCYPNYTANLWWYMLEDILLENNSITLRVNNKKTVFSGKSQKKKDKAFFEIRKLIISSKKEQQKDVLFQLENDYNKCLQSYVEREALSWDEIIKLAKDDLVTIGGHTLNHYALNTLNESEVLEELIGSKIEIEKHIKSSVTHFAYPFGTKAEIGRREINIVEQSQEFATSTTTRMGNIFKSHKSHMHALPRIQVLGNQQDLSILDMYLCGMLPAIKNKFNKIVTG